MSIKVGITGGIGSGKSYVARMFQEKGVPYYDADTEAKKLMASHPEIRKRLIESFGPEVYSAGGELNRHYLSKQIFDNKEKLEVLNSIVHPIVIQHAEEWAERQNAPYSLKEAALLFESGSYRNLDYVILVVAPQELKIQRVQARDEITKKEVLDRMDKQMSDEEKEELADFIIVNDEQEPLAGQVEKLHSLLISKSQKS